MNKVLSVLGIIMVAIGTIWSVWSVLVTDIAEIGTAYNEDHKSEAFELQKRQVIKGMLFIVVGSIFQIIGILL
ncbi:hypothetical protein [Butyrivibrio hungatei]|uniref:Uncharacterized protein n=1 Tax=Butyrivibrio hungatei TaxID=185008 RepID=A0A1D9P0S1_9FIRM|nr:hypothetical protein [Butyrivibrio hungatei]AOZ96226.1 hypothetical protein bhn_I1192 [Butyrivibrio hungatei]